MASRWLQECWKVRPHRTSAPWTTWPAWRCSPNVSGGGLILTDVCPDLRALVELTGLVVEMDGEPERGEEPLGVQQIEEERHAGDLPP